MVVPGLDLSTLDKTAVRASPDPVHFALLELARRGEYGPGDPETIISERLATVRREVAEKGSYRSERRFMNGRWIEGRILPIEGGDVSKSIET